MGLERLGFPVRWLAGRVTSYTPPPPCASIEGLLVSIRWKYWFLKGQVEGCWYQLEFGARKVCGDVIDNPYGLQEHRNLLRTDMEPERELFFDYSTTWVPKECNRIACWALFAFLGQYFGYLWGPGTCYVALKTAN